MSLYSSHWQEAKAKGTHTKNRVILPFRDLPDQTSGVSLGGYSGLPPNPEDKLQEERAVKPYDRGRRRQNKNKTNKRMRSRSHFQTHGVAGFTHVLVQFSHEVSTTTHSALLKSKLDMGWQIEVAVSKSVAFVSYRKQIVSRRCAVSAVSFCGGPC